MNSNQPTAKQYGLIKPSKAKQPAAAKPNVFGNDSSSDSDAPAAENWGKAALKAAQHGSVQAAQTRQVIRRAMQEDPSLFQYDEVYEDIQQSKGRPAAGGKEAAAAQANKPRYMQRLLESAEQRRRQQERRVERQVQREREEEGDQFADKEAFVTSAYRERLVQRQKEIEEEERMKRIEAMTDVTKMKDLGSFYRHMYRSRSSPSGDAAADVKPEPGTSASGAHEQPEVKREPASPPPAATGDANKPSDSGKRRQYRRRRNESEVSEDVPAASHRRNHSESEGDENGSQPDEERRGTSHSNGRKRADTRSSSSSSEEDASSEEGSSGKSPSDRASQRRGSKRRASGEGTSAATAPEPEVRQKRATTEEREERRRLLYQKRTVGAVFEAALERYRQRQQARGSAAPVVLTPA